MAQRDTKSTALKERPSSVKFQTSLSQPAPSNQQKSTSRRHLTLPVPLLTTYSQSPAERYFTSLSQMFIDPNEQPAISPETPSSITGTTTSSLQSSMSHAELMHKWHQKKVNEICKKQKHRYVYGTPASSFTFSSPMNLPSPRSNIPPSQTIKKG